MHCRDGNAAQLITGTEELQIAPQVVAQRVDVTGQQHTLPLLCEMSGSVHCYDGFASAGRTSDLEHTIEGAVREISLRRMQKGNPCRHRRIEQRAQVIAAAYYEEVARPVSVFNRRAEYTDWYWRHDQSTCSHITQTFRNILWQLL